MLDTHRMTIPCKESVERRFLRVREKLLDQPVIFLRPLMATWTKLFVQVIYDRGLSGFGASCGNVIGVDCPGRE